MKGDREIDAQPVSAGVYCRMSLAAMGDTTKVDDQERICRQLAERRGWEVADIYCDNNRSAWQRNRKRPEWDRMLCDIEAGKINAIVVYHGDRMIRQPFDLEVLINLAYGKGVKLASPTGDRDLSRSDDLYIVRIEAAGQCRESDRTSERRKTQYERWAREGRVRPGGRGGRAFGYSTDGVSLYPPDRCLTATRHEAAEQDVVREMAGRVLAGEETAAIARDVSARAWRTPAGNEFTYTTVRKMLLRPRYAGLMPDGESKAAWPAILDRDVWEQVAAVLSSKATGYSFATNARRYWQTGIAECGTCGEPLAIRHSTRGKSLLGYGCINRACPRKVHRSVTHLDAYVLGRLIAYLGSDEIRDAMKVPGDLGAATEISQLEQRRDQARATLENLVDNPSIDPALIVRTIAGFDQRIAGLRARAATTARRQLLATHAGITREQFEGLPLATRRAILGASYRVVVWPSGRRGPGFDPSTVRCIPVED